MLLGAAAAAVPASLVAVPADVIKKQVVTGVHASPLSCVRHIVGKQGVSGLFLGWQANVLKDVPFAAVKMSLYEGLLWGYMRLSGQPTGTNPTPLEASGAGLASGIVTAVLTCPLDVVNTRIKAGDVATTSMLEAGRQVVGRDGTRALFVGLGPRMFIIGFGSSLFWSVYANVKARVAGQE